MQDAAETLIPALVTSRLDYCNALNAVFQTTRSAVGLQLVQNMAARIPICSQTSEHIITPGILRQLHWLSVK